MGKNALNLLYEIIESVIVVFSIFIELIVTCLTTLWVKKMFFGFGYIHCPSLYIIPVIIIKLYLIIYNTHSMPSWREGDKIDSSASSNLIMEGLNPAHF